MNRITLIILGLLAVIPTGHLMAQGFTEPTLTLYGRVRQVGSGAEHVLQSGELSLTLTNANLPGNSITRTVPLQPVGSGPIKLYSYAMSVPLKYNIAEYELAEFIEVEGAGAQIQLGDIMVDGEPAHLASVTDALLSFTQTDRADERRVDIVVDTPATDSDGDGVPDWWEEENGFNPLFAGDADLDADGDGLSNGEEFRFGTNPNDTDGIGNRAPLLLTRQVTITRDGTSGLALRIVDSDSAPDQIVIVPLVIPSGLMVYKDGVPNSPGGISVAEINAGRITLVDDGTASSGEISFQLSDGVHAAAPASLLVDVFEPSVTGGVVASLWLDAQDLGLNDGDPIQFWEDRAGNLDSMLDPRAFIQPDPSAQPSFELVNGKPAVAFDGAGEYLA
ncbi:MAG: cadherin-like domain-containing protein, partial [Verrucomicrobiales bacterium]